MVAIAESLLGICEKITSLKGKENQSDKDGFMHFKQDREKLDAIFREVVNHYVDDNKIEKAQWPLKFRFELAFYPTFDAFQKK